MFRTKGLKRTAVMTMTIFYNLTSVLLGVILFFPVRKFILALNVNRFQSRESRKITAEELAALRKKVTVIAAIIAVTFSFIYNKILVLKFYGGV
jgi:hypothetical protein